MLLSDPPGNTNNELNLHFEQLEEKVLQNRNLEMGLIHLGIVCELIDLGNVFELTDFVCQYVLASFHPSEFPYSLFLPPTTEEVFRLYEYLERHAGIMHLPTSMPPSGFKPQSQQPATSSQLH
ncbi:hypothetical protein TNCV_309021 [Trichonephila clavipes]|nr:hypothetical protein TNCV_309021 [Trichonephila clavipes]